MKFIPNGNYRRPASTTPTRLRRRGHRSAGGSNLNVHPKDIIEASRAFHPVPCPLAPAPFFVIALLIFAGIAGHMPRALAQQPAATPQMRLVKIEVKGLERLTPEQVVSASGLQTGQAVDAAALDAAAERLLAGGMFRKLSYHLTSTRGEAVVTFDVEEAKVSLPVVFDNFVWFDDADLVAALRTAIPSFDGTLPDTNGAISTATRALQDLLRRHNLPGRVEYMPSGDLTGTIRQHVFVVKDVKLPICSLRIPGANAILESVLLARARPLIGEDYSREFVTGFAKGTLLPLYRQKGRLRASFRDPIAKIAESGSATEQGCAQGVNVTMPVDEGVAYLWQTARWSGNTALTAAQLDKALGMREGDLADGLKIDKGLSSVIAAYGRKGYITARLRPAPEFDESLRRVSYSVLVTEGPQYLMGTLTIVGLPEPETNRLRAEWKIASREPFDALYAREFGKTIVEFITDQARENPAIKGYINDFDISPAPDPQTLKVDVKITFKLRTAATPAST